METEASDEEWKKNVEIHETAKYKELKEIYSPSKPETSVYKPFCNWVNYIIGCIKEKFPEETKSMDLKLHALGNKTVAGKAGKRKPGIALTRGGIDISDLIWDLVRARCDRVQSE